MQRVHFLCEGQTEEAFVKNLLTTHLSRRAIHAIPISLRGRVKIDRIKQDVRNTLRKDHQAHCTTLIDYYGLPTNFPGKNDAKGTSSNKSHIVCEALQTAIDDLGENLARRFIPYVQMHEYEALLFSDPIIFAKAIGEADAAPDLLKIRQQFTKPEDINDSVDTAPSKRIKAIIRDYDKPIGGFVGALDIGLAKMRAECPLFNTWLEHIEALAPEA